MKRTNCFIISLLALVHIGIAQSQTPGQRYWEDERRFGENKEVGHATYTPYGSEKDMLSDTAFYHTPWVYTQSKSALLLNGDWHFYLVSNPDLRPADFYKMDYDVSTWATIPVPSNWEMHGYDRPYTATWSIRTPTRLRSYRPERASTTTASTTA